MAFQNAEPQALSQSEKGIVSPDQCLLTHPSVTVGVSQVPVHLKWGGVLRLPIV